MSRFRVERLLVRRDRTPDEQGFILLESVVAISIITIIMSALGVFFLNTIASASQQRAKKAAVQVADTTVENLHRLHPSSIVSGRDQASVAAQFGAASTVVQPWLAGRDQAYDPNASTGSGATAPIPTAPTPVKPDQISYAVNQYLVWCYLPSDRSSTACLPKSAVSNPVQYIQAVIAVAWSAPHCNPASCTYVTSTLISGQPDQIFKLNQPLPPAPIAASPGNQTNAVRDTVNLQLAVQGSSGVPPFTWSSPVTGQPGALPLGLAMNQAGLITGSPDPSVANQTFTVTVTVTDAFLRQASVTFTWQILPPLLIADPGARANTTADTVSLTLSASGGTGSGYVWGASGLPSGLTISAAGTISGKPTVVGNYTVTATVTDSSGTRQATRVFTWTITYPPLAASNPGNQASTVGRAIPPLQLSASGGSGGYVWSGAVPAGLTLSAAGLLTGTPTTAASSQVTLTVADPTAGYTKQVGFTWTVFAAPSVTSPGNQTSTVGAAVSRSLAASCPNAPCSYTLNNGPAGLSVNAGGVITGTVGGSAQTYANVSVTVTDKAGATATTAPFTWTVNPAPTISGPGNQKTIQSSGAVALNLAPFVTGGTGSYAYSAAGLPAWLSVNTSTGVISGTAPATASTTSGITVTATDQQGVAASSAPFSWYVTTNPTISTIPDQSTKRRSAGSLDASGFVSGGAGSLTYSAAGLPAWLSINPATGLISGTPPNQTGTTSNITVTVTDAFGAAATSNAFKWSVTN
jgi:type II secretory pathway pseudopilin PulG